VIRLEALITIFVGVRSDGGVVTFSAAEVKLYQGLGIRAFSNRRSQQSNNWTLWQFALLHQASASQERNAAQLATPPTGLIASSRRTGRELEAGIPLVMPAWIGRAWDSKHVFTRAGLILRAGI